eukprot:CAMPEP_0198502602 /NCGR_PEP_ID=MMETSP1462-20131121/9408_1 /TAXON_ID=1333877 /ORGANISM="Brandtodinium nutriculum, Strain RCC3387" /LENGTH=733 /DNA_ID=CAMNT_0044231687 /DNA_START=137 /DNA_END=2335 /DNA_ORIENTATION=+
MEASHLHGRRSSGGHGSHGSTQTQRRFSSSANSMTVAGRRASLGEVSAASSHQSKALGLRPSPSESSYNSDFLVRHRESRRLGHSVYGMSHQESVSSTFLRDAVTGPPEEQHGVAWADQYSDRDPFQSESEKRMMESQMSNGREWAVMAKKSMPGQLQHLHDDEGNISFDEVVSANKRLHEANNRAASRLELLPGSWILSIWRTVLIVVVIWTAVFAPVEIAFSWWEAPKFVDYFGYATDILCVADMVLNFNVAYMHHGRLVTGHRAIAKHYLKTWFLPDFIINVPWNYIFGDVFSDSDGKSRKLGKVMKLPKVLRLTRLMRVAREEAHYFGTAFALCGMVLAAHYSACLWALMLIDCHTDCPDIAGAYFEAFSVSMATLGGADAWTRWLNRPDSIAQDAYFQWGNSSRIGADIAASVISLMGFCFLAMLFSTIGQTLERNDSRTRLFHERLWNLSAVIQRHDIDDALVRRAKRHYHYLWTCGSDASRAILQDDALSADLRRQFAFSFYGALLNKVPFLGNAHASFVKQVCAHVEMEVFSPLDYIIVAGEAGTELYFIAVGRVTIQVPGTDKVVKTLDEGSFFGEMGLLFPETRCTMDVVGQSSGWLLVVPRSALEMLCTGELLEAFRSVALERFHAFASHADGEEHETDEVNLDSSLSVAEYRSSAPLARISQITSSSSGGWEEDHDKRREDCTRSPCLSDSSDVNTIDNLKHEAADFVASDGGAGTGGLLK